MKKFSKIGIGILLGIFLFQGLNLNLVFAQGPIEYNKNVIRESQRLDPLLIFSNTPPKEFNEKIAKAISDALGVDIYSLITADELDEIIRTTFQESQMVTFEQLLKQVNKAIAERARQKVVDNMEQIMSATPTEYAKKVVKREFIKQLDQSLQTDWEPWVEQVVVAVGAGILTEALANNAPGLLNPDLYNLIYQKLTGIYNTKIKDLPYISELISAKLIDYLPSQMADFLTSVNDLISGQMRSLKEGITNELVTLIEQPVISAITDALSGVLPTWLGGFLEALETMVMAILREATYNYVDYYVTDYFRENFWTVYKYQDKLGEWIEDTVYDVLSPKIQQDLKKTLLEILPEDAQKFFKDLAKIAKQIADALTPPPVHAEQPALELLFPDMKKFFNKTLYELLTENADERWKDFLKTRIKEKLPEVLTKKTWYDLFPPKAKTKIIDLFTGEYVDVLKNKKFIDSIEDSQTKECLEKPWKDVDHDICAGLLNKSFLGNNPMVGATGVEAFKKTVLDIMTPENRSFFKKTLLEALPEELRRTLFQYLNIDDPATPRNEARTQSIVGFLSEEVGIFIELVNEYIPEKENRPPPFNQVLGTLILTPYQFVSKDCPYDFSVFPPTFGEQCGLNNPKLADDLDTPFPLLFAGATSSEYLKKTWVDILAKIGIPLNKSLLDILKYKNPKLYQFLTSKLGDMITREDLDNHPNNSMLETISLNLTGDYSISDHILKPPIKWAELSFLNKSFVQLIQEQGGAVHQFFKKTPFECLPQEIQNKLSETIGETIKNVYPFNQKIINLLPKDWQGTVKDLFNLTEQDLDDAATSAIAGTKDYIEVKLNSMMNWTRQKMAEISTSLFNKKIAEKTGQSISVSDEKIKEISENIAEALEPIIEKAIKEKMNRGYLINSLNEIKIGQ